jgi:uncharacterized membrane protein
MPGPFLPRPPPVRTQTAGQDPQMSGTTKVIRGPRLRAIIGHLSLSLLTASVIPGVLFYLCLVTGNVWTALIAALAWCYGAITWRMATRRRASGLLLLTAAGLTLRTAVAFASGDAYLYLLQPVINNAVVAALFLASLATARPVVARLAADFYPMNADVANRARVQRLFWNLTLLWAMVCLAKSVVTLWLLHSQSVETFVAVKSVLFLAITVAATAATLSSAVWVARKEGLLTTRTVEDLPGVRPA